MSRITGFALLRAEEAARAQRRLQSAGGDYARHGPAGMLAASASGNTRAVAPDGQVLVWLDGFLFNRQTVLGELRDARTASGGEPTDAELVVSAYRAFGLKAFERFSGQFAIVLVDLAQGRCHLVRDQLGAKTLHYAVDGGILWFSTGFRPLLGLAGRARIDVRRLFEFALHGDVLPPGSLYEGITTLPCGHRLAAGDGVRAPRSEAYHELFELVSEPIHDRLKRASADGYLTELDGHLHRSMQENLAGADTCAVSLSGGLDSAVVLAIAARYARVQAIHQSVPHGRVFDERPMAETVAKRVGVPIDVTIVSPDLYRQELAAATFANEMPLWHVQNLGFHLLARRARELGQGSLFAGDATGMAMSAAAAMHWKLLLRGLAMLRLMPAPVRGIFRKLGDAELGLPVDTHGFPWSHPLVSQLTDGYARSDLLRQAEERLAFVSDPLERRVLAGRFAEVRHWYNRFYYRGERLGHQHSVGFQTPLGDLESLAFALNTPLKFLYRRGQHKWALKELGSRYVGREVAFQKKIAWNMPADLYFEPFATPRFFADGYCADTFGLTRDVITDSLPRWRTTGFQFSRLVHIEVWGRLFARGESVDQVSGWLAGF